MAPADTLMLQIKEPQNSLTLRTYLQSEAATFSF